MPHLYDFDKETYATLLASEVLDASKGALFGATGLKPDDTNRTILIGLGGTGVRTIDYVKGAISKRLDPTWKKYIGFLGVDSSWTEFDGATYLDPAECVKVTKNGVAQRMQNPETYPAAVRSFMLPGEQLGSLSSDGAGRTRLVGKVKIHDQEPGNIGVDEEIVSKLISLRTTLEALPATAAGSYQVYVIGSVCGGTCSGSFLEMPSLIRKAIPDKIKVNAMLYLPDTLATLDPKNESQLYANGYASLKELNYYMGMYMRPEYAENWSYNSKADPVLTLKSSMAQEGFINVPYLVGTTNGAAVDAAQTAMETIAEFLISLLTKISVSAGGVFLTSAFESNATAAAKVGSKLTLPGFDGREASNEFHEFPKRFAAIGFAEASAPQKLVRAYTVGCVCEKAGLKPVSATERASLAAAGADVFLPFRGEDDLLNATEGTAKAKALLAPIEKILGIIHTGSFNFAEDLQETDITWKKIKDNAYDHPAIAGKTESIIKSRTNPDMMDNLRKRIQKAYDEYRKNVHEYVRKDGPFAFANLYEGRFTPVGTEFGTGISRMIQNLMDGKLIDGKNYNGWKDVETARNELDMIRRTIIDTKAGPLGIETSKHKDQAAQWVAAYNAWGKARINEVRREVALGTHGALHDSFQMPAAKLAQEVGAFGHILVNLTGIYQNHGKKMETYETFSTAQDNKTEVNLAAVNSASYNWLKAQAEGTLGNVNAHTLRDNLIDNFFSMGVDNLPNSQKWLDVPKQLVTTNVNGEVTLTVPDVAIPAREIFDKYLAEKFPATLDVSIETMFTQLQSTGVDYDATAHAIMSQLVIRSQPHFNGDIPADSLFSYIMYPSNLKSSSGEGPAIAAAIENAAQVVFPGVQVYASDDADSIMLYQMAAPMEIYRLADLENWEKHYEKGIYGIENRQAYLHGFSPDVVVETKPGEASKYVELTRWADYPAIARRKGDPRKPDPETGKVSREGQLRLELDKLIDQAKTLGVLFSEKTPDGWIVKRVHCNKSIAWKFDLMECQPDMTTGLLPLGKALAEAVASQNGKELADITRKVYLALGGLMDKAHETEELAWEFAARTLRAHVPMHIEVRETVKKFVVWAEEIFKFNRDIMKQFLPAKMVYMLKSRILRRNEDGSWTYMQPNGTPKPVAALTPVMMKFLPPRDKFLVENGLLGYYLFTKLSAVLSTSDAFDAAYDRARKTLEQLAIDGEIEALTIGEELSAQILAEREVLLEKGARLDGDADAEPREKFAKAFGTALNKDQLKEIDLFYFRLGLWEVI